MTAARTIPPALLGIAFSAEDLCTRCGTCAGVCPRGAIAIVDGRYPRLDPQRCTACGLCGRTCPGGRLRFGDLSAQLWGHRRDARHFDGHVGQTYLGYATDDALRSGGAGGGVVTALLSDLLLRGVVDGCIATRMDPARPWIGEPFVARTAEELRCSQGSRYMIISTNRTLAEVRRFPGRYAFAALPCQVHGLRLAARQDTELEARIHVVIGLFCGGSLEPLMVRELLQSKGIGTGDLAHFEFRGGRWPGQMRAHLKNGRVIPLHYSNYQEGAYNYCTGLYMPRRCQTCIDGASEFADVSISDVWTRDAEGRFKFKAHSRLLLRTARGAEAVRGALDSGRLQAFDVSRDASYRTHRLQTRRKGMIAPLRVQRWRALGRPVPDYDRQAPPASARERIVERALSTLLQWARFKGFRYPILAFLTSIYAKPLIDLRLVLKRRKYRRQRVPSAPPGR
jgi:coenzyme F420 hydrogenase subunit beta